MGYWSGLPFPSLEDLPDPGIKPWPPSLQADSLPAELSGKPSPYSQGRNLVIIFSPTVHIVKLLSCVWLFATPWTVAYHSPLSMGFSRQEYWSGLPFPSLEDLPNPGTEPRSSALQADALPSESSGKPIVFVQLCEYATMHWIMHYKNRSILCYVN